MLAIAPAAVAQAAAYTVNDPADLALAPSSPAASCATGSTTCTLRAAVQSADAAGGSSTITVPAGTYKLTIPSTASDDPSNGDLDINANITITGAGSGSTIIDANSVDRAFAVQTGGALTISGMTIENGSPSKNSTGGTDGGAIYDANRGLSVTDVTFRDNAASDQGGAIWISPSGLGNVVNVAGSTFLNNNSGTGGAIYADLLGGTLNNDTDTFVDNSASCCGGAIDQEAGQLNVQGSTFSGNAGLSGGAIRTAGFASLTIDSSTLSGNHASPGTTTGASDGGAIVVFGGALTAGDDLFTGNSAGTEGGAIFVDPMEASTDGLPDEPVAFSGDEFDGNTAGTDGGALAWLSGTLTIAGSSFIGNTTPKNGGAIAAEASFLWTMSNTTMAGNSAPSGAGIYFDMGGTPVSWNNDTIAFNSAGGSGDGNLQGGGVGNAPDATSSGGAGVANTLIADNFGGDCGNGSTPAATTDQFTAADAGHNLDSDGTCFSSTVSGDRADASAALDQPADNGGPLVGDPSAGTKTLHTVAELRGSASIGGGSGCETTDERGVARTGSCDIGSYQAAAAALALSGSAPATANQGGAFEATFAVTDNGPAPSTGTVLSIPLPSGMTAYAASPSQGACTESSKAVDCSLGNVSNGAPATVTLVISDASPGTATLTGTASNAEGGSSTRTETTTIKPAGPSVKVTKPSARTGKASKVAVRSAKIAGTYTVGSQTTLVFFQYGTSKSFGSTTKPASKTKSRSISATLKKLKANTIYHYRLVAINASGVAYGKSKTLKTKKK